MAQRQQGLGLVADWLMSIFRQPLFPQAWPATLHGTWAHESPTGCCPLATKVPASSNTTAGCLCLQTSAEVQCQASCAWRSGVSASPRIRGRESRVSGSGVAAQTQTTGRSPCASSTYLTDINNTTWSMLKGGTLLECSWAAATCREEPRKAAPRSESFRVLDYRNQERWCDA